MSLITLLVGAWSWFKKTFVDHIQSAATVAVTVAETVKSLLASKEASILENVADAVTGTQVPTAIANDINAAIPKILAVELGIEGLPDNATPEQIAAFEQAILGAFNITNNNSKLYTELAAQTYGIIQAHIDNGTTNFAGWVAAVEAASVDLQNDLAANPAPASVPVISPVAAAIASVNPAPEAPVATPPAPQVFGQEAPTS